jgi:DnaK suppressor protein
MDRVEEYAKLREILIRKRQEIFEAHKGSEETRVALSEPEIEPEEDAQNEALIDVIATMDEREKEQISAIDAALTKFELGEYGSCEICGKKIDVKRLLAIPWTLYCKIHSTTESKRAGPRV